MRASRVVSLSALTLALTIGGAAAAAADSVNSTTSATTDTGSTSSYVHSNNHAYSMGSLSTSPNGVNLSDTATGVNRDGNAYYDSVTKYANATGVGQSTTYNSTGNDPAGRGEGYRGDAYRGGDEWGHHGYDHHGLLSDVLRDVL